MGGAGPRAAPSGGTKLISNLGLGNPSLLDSNRSTRKNPTGPNSVGLNTVKFCQVLHKACPPAIALSTIEGLVFSSSIATSSQRFFH